MDHVNGTAIDIGVPPPPTPTARITIRPLPGTGMVEIKIVVYGKADGVRSDVAPPHMTRTIRAWPAEAEDLALALTLASAEVSG